MGFQIKDFVSIAAGMLNHIRGTTKKITDLQPGSVTRTLVEAPAVEIEELYLQILNGLREAIPVATFKSFNFTKLAAMYARGYVSVSIATAPTTAFVVPAGTVFTSSDGRGWKSTEAVTWVQGVNSIRIPVIAEATGIKYNVSAGSITASAFFNDSYTISNSAITSGRDLETDAEQEARFATFIGALSRGTTSACLYGAGSVTVNDDQGNIEEYVTRIGYTEIAGYVKIFIYSSAGLPSRELVDKAQLVINGWRDPDTGEVTPGYRSAGVNVEVGSMIERPIPLNVRVSTFSGQSVDDVMKQAIVDVFASLLSSAAANDIIYADAIETALLGVTGVKSVVIDITENIVCGPSEALIPGTVTVTPL